MAKKKKVLINGISQLWGTGGESFPGSLGYEREELSDKNLSPKEYFQYAREYSDAYPYGDTAPSKYIIHDLNENVLVCVKCKDTGTKLEACNNCGNNTNIFWSPYNSFSCQGCKRTHQQIRWVCSKCACDNSITNTLFHWVEIDEIPYEKPAPPKEGCFIATVCYGDYNSKEVIILRRFRAEKLLKTFSGRMFINFYYSVSPFFATLISKSHITKKLVRKYLLEKIVTKLKEKTNTVGL